MNRGEILDAARQAVTVDRAATHGDAERNSVRRALSPDASPADRERLYLACINLTKAA